MAPFKVFYSIDSAMEELGQADPLTPNSYLQPNATTDVKPPDFNHETHTCRFVDGAWKVEEIEVYDPEDEIIYPTGDQAMRSERDGLLYDSDFRVLPDYQGSDVEAWKTYRQALRDVPQNNPNPVFNKSTGMAENVNWPTPPA
jgi:hypothetical protein